MTRKFCLGLGPGLLLAIGILASTLTAKLTADSGWWVLAGPLLLAVSVVGADIFHARLKGEPSGPSRGALLVGGTFLLTGFIVAWRDPNLVKLLIPVIGTTAWFTYLPGTDGDARRVSESEHQPTGARPCLPGSWV